MYMDVSRLRNYYASPLGTLTERLVARRISDIWPAVSGLKILGVGFAIPWLDACFRDAERVLAAMPAPQGVIRWPDQSNLAMLIDEPAMPLPDASIDRILMVHALESSESPHRLLREVWRVLSDAGRVLLVVPNRRGIWARLDHTPFGQGRPFSISQLETLLTETMFTVEGTSRALFMPPFTNKVLRRGALIWERTLGPVAGNFAGALIVEAAKEMFAPVGVVESQRVPARGTQAVTSPFSQAEELFGQEKQRLRA